MLYKVKIMSDYRLRVQLATGVTESLKVQDQMLWVQRMNSIRDRAKEVVNHELIYAYGIGWRGVIPAAVCFSKNHKTS